MATLADGWRASKVVAQGFLCLRIGELAAHRKGAIVACLVRHARVLPVDEAVLVLLVDKEVEVEEVIVRDAARESVLLSKLFELQDLLFELVVPRDFDGPALCEEPLVPKALLDKVKASAERGAALVKLAAHLHGAFKLHVVMRVKGTGVAHKPRDLPSLSLVLVDEGVVEPKVTREAKPRLLGSAVDHLLGAKARMTVHVLPLVRAFAHREVAREVGEALLQGIEAVDLRLLASKDRDDVFKDVRVNVLDEGRVKATHLIEGVKLMD